MDETRRLAGRLGASIKAALADARMTVTALHKRSGISRETIYRILRGQTLPSLDVLLRIATELKVSPGALIDGRVIKSNVSETSRKPSEAREVADKLADLQARVERLERRRAARR